jgi:hypothetical protein
MTPPPADGTAVAVAGIRLFRPGALRPPRTRDVPGAPSVP